MNDFKTGDIVVLKSGGPKMTVKGLSASNGNFVCQWFAGKKLEEGLFKSDSLQAPVVEEEPEVE
jgi:uncharacterized protein YodC (DUF2158 family)